MAWLHTWLLGYGIYAMIRPWLPSGSSDIAERYRDTNISSELLYDQTPYVSAHPIFPSLCGFGNVYLSPDVVHNSESEPRGKVLRKESIFWEKQNPNQKDASAFSVSGRVLID
ncbi:hypothetical protein B0T20DRAFT_473574 [Sordaria brevicollis]|uniref:Uncharacterized protein n=1 Tax=Sordaria brevicollis TaxID=83679 RepID=A0AAE0U2L5_SORBR|nr:hypothetical protein B0T20DRAFT_473574 [Sordaria brevicollis]